MSKIEGELKKSGRSPSKKALLIQRTFVLKIHDVRNVAGLVDEKPKSLHVDLKYGKKVASKEVEPTGTRGKWKPCVITLKAVITSKETAKVILRRADKRILGIVKIPISKFNEHYCHWITVSPPIKNAATPVTKVHVLEQFGRQRSGSFTSVSYPAIPSLVPENGLISPALWIECDMEENQEKRASLRNDASIQERRERILAKPCRTINLSNAREEKEGNWNVRFQAILESIRSSQQAKYDSASLNFQMFSNLVNLTRDFVHCATAYGKIIIEEAHLPKAMKTIAPAEVGGVAGGEKYIIRDILFKFAIDEKRIFDDQAAASKVAGHDLKGLNCYVNCEINGLCFPLMALLDYRGLRLIAVSVIPIDKGTIVYGASDASKTDRVIHDEDERLRAMMELSARILNLKEHPCVSVNGPKNLHSAIDLEGHKGHDGRYYLIDFSRAMPPVEPVPGVRNGYLYQLLRPEFVKSYHKPLSPDAFAKQFREDVRDDEEVREATQYLMRTVIPQVAQKLFYKLQATKLVSLQQLRIPELIHKQGVNCRYLGLLAEQWIDQTSIAHKYCRILLLLEMLARVIKIELNRKWRDLGRSLRIRPPPQQNLYDSSPAVGPSLSDESYYVNDRMYMRTAIDYLNLVFGNSPASEQYWSTSMKELLQKKFCGNYLLPRELEGSFKSFATTIPPEYGGNAVDGRALLFERVRQMMQIHLQHGGEFLGGSIFQEDKPIDEFHLDTIEIKVKQMNLSQLAQGYCLLYKGMKMNLPMQQKRCFMLSRETFENALNSETNNKSLLRGYARSLLLLYRLILREEPQLVPDEVNELLEKAGEYLSQALKIDPSDSQSLFAMAQYLQELPHRQDEVEELYLRALEEDPSYVQCMFEYAQWLTSRQSTDGKRKYQDELYAELLLRRMGECSMKDIGVSEPAQKLTLSMLAAMPSNPQFTIPEGHSVPPMHIELQFQLKPSKSILHFHSMITIDDAFVWSGCENGEIYVWDKAGRHVRSFLAHSQTVFSMTRCMGHVWTASSDGYIKVWSEIPTAGDSAPAREFRTKHLHKSTLIAYDKKVMSFNTAGIITVWDARTFERIFESQIENSEGVCALAKISEDEFWLGLSNGSILFFNPKTLTCGSSIPAHKRRINCIARVGNTVWTTSDETIVWDITTRQRLHHIPVRLYSMLPVGERFLWASAELRLQQEGDRNVYLSVWDPETYVPVQHLRYHTERVVSMCILQESGVWTASWDGSICVWNVIANSSSYLSTSPRATSAVQLGASASSSPSSGRYSTSLPRTAPVRSIPASASQGDNSPIFHGSFGSRDSPSRSTSTDSSSEGRLSNPALDQLNPYVTDTPPTGSFESSTNLLNPYIDSAPGSFELEPELPAPSPVRPSLPMPVSPRMQSPLQSPQASPVALRSRLLSSSPEVGRRSSLEQQDLTRSGFHATPPRYASPRHPHKLPL